jgi:predicted esterase YcpF (UPF0227 family)
MYEDILITIHGGCFVGGNSSYDKEQTNFLKNIFKNVYQIDFVKTRLSETLVDIELQIKKLKKEHINKKFIVLGRSSGGYLAKVLYEMGLFDKAIYLCPVFNPILRGEKISKLGEKQKEYFNKEHIYLTDGWNKEEELLFLAINDENVPKECFTQEQINDAIYVGPSTHIGMINCTSDKFRQELIKFIGKK